MSQENVGIDGGVRRWYKHRMRGVRFVAVAVALAMLPASGGGAVAANANPASDTQPTLSLERNCEVFKDSGDGTIDTRLTGLPPFTPFEWKLEISDGTGVGPVRFTTDANGNGSTDGFYIGSSTPETFTVTIVWSGGTLTQSLYVDCSKPASKKDCKRGGWRDFDFKNQGQCIRFVKRQARQGCRVERDAIGRQAFREKYGGGEHHGCAMRNCVKQAIGSS